MRPRGAGDVPGFVGLRGWLSFLFKRASFIFLHACADPPGDTHARARPQHPPTRRAANAPAGPRITNGCR